MADEKKPYDAGDERQVGKKLDKLKMADLQLKADTSFVLAAPEGRRFALHILGLCGVYDDGFAPNALVMANLSGMRKVGLKIINLLEASDKDAYIKLIAENLISKEASNG